MACVVASNDTFAARCKPDREHGTNPVRSAFANKVIQTTRISGGSDHTLESTMPQSSLVNPLTVAP
jgi:hypothetical protein